MSQDQSIADQKVVQLMAAAEVRETQAYLSAGRMLSSLNENTLQIYFLSAFRAWAREVDNPDFRMAVDFGSAEYRLRGAEPPYEMLAPEVERIAIIIGARQDNLSEEELDDADMRLSENAEQAVKSYN